MNTAIMIFAVIAGIWLAYAAIGLLASMAIWALIRWAAGPRLMGSPVGWFPPKNVVGGSLLFGPFAWLIALVAQLKR